MDFFVKILVLGGGGGWVLINGNGWYFFQKFGVITSPHPATPTIRFETVRKILFDTTLIMLERTVHLAIISLLVKGRFQNH